jgi:tetratricopeptide (TPR) repeat protein
MLWLLIGALLTSPQESLVDKASKALAAFQVQEAIASLLRARQQGPHKFDAHTRLYELLGIAYAYADRKADALSAFEMLLTLDPGYAISYTLSPKVTFIFEQARKLARQQVPPTLNLSWPPKLMVSDAIPISVEVTADPKGFLRRAVLYSRLKGTLKYRAAEMALPNRGAQTRVLLPPAAPESRQAEVLELYVVASDAQGNEVLRVAHPRYPLEIPLAYQEVVPWYKRWWVWAIAGLVITAGTGTAIYLLKRPPPPTVGGHFQVD